MMMRVFSKEGVQRSEHHLRGTSRCHIRSGLCSAPPLLLALRDVCVMCGLVFCGSVDDSPDDCKLTMRDANHVHVVVL